MNPARTGGDNANHYYTTKAVVIIYVIWVLLKSVSLIQTHGEVYVIYV